MWERPGVLVYMPVMFFLLLIKLDIIMNESVTRRLFMLRLSNICLINGFQHSGSAKHCKYFRKESGSDYIKHHLFQSLLSDETIAWLG